MKIFEIDSIQNSLGILEVKDTGEGYYWNLANYDSSDYWVEIPEYLYKALEKFYRESEGVEDIQLEIDL